MASSRPGIGQRHVVEQCGARRSARGRHPATAAVVREPVSNNRVPLPDAERGDGLRVQPPPHRGEVRARVFKRAVSVSRDTGAGSRRTIGRTPLSAPVYARPARPPAAPRVLGASVARRAARAAGAADRSRPPGARRPALRAHRERDVDDVTAMISRITRCGTRTRRRCRRQHRNSGATMFRRPRGVHLAHRDAADDQKRHPDHPGDHHAFRHLRSTTRPATASLAASGPMAPIAPAGAGIPTSTPFGIGGQVGVQQRVEAGQAQRNAHRVEQLPPIQPRRECDSKQRYTMNARATPKFTASASRSISSPIREGGLEQPGDTAVERVEGSRRGQQRHRLRRPLVERELHRGQAQAHGQHRHGAGHQPRADQPRGTGFDHGSVANTVSPASVR